MQSSFWRRGEQQLDEGSHTRAQAPQIVSQHLACDHSPSSLVSTLSSTLSRSLCQVLGRQGGFTMPRPSRAKSHQNIGFSTHAGSGKKPNSIWQEQKKQASKPTDPTQPNPTPNKPPSLALAKVFIDTNMPRSSFPLGGSDKGT